MTNSTRLLAGIACVTLLSTVATAGSITLGGFTFNDQQFGNSLDESDGGTYLNANWLNTVNSNPGNPGALTGANFNTGIANIGLGGTPVYTIHYNTPIVNNAGDDFGIVALRFSADTFTVAVSTDNGANFSSNQVIAAANAVTSGVSANYFYNGGGPFGATLFVYSLDLNLFGIGSGASVNAIRITSADQGDLIRVAGMNPSSGVPEPASLLLIGSGLFGLAGLQTRRLRRK